MKFIKYSSIDNLSNKLLEKMMQYDSGKLFCVTPKIDGSNFAIMFDESGEIIPARRGDILDGDSNFFNFQRVIDKYGEALKRLRQAIINELNIAPRDETVVNVSFHGELCGGYYPGLKPSGAGVKALQKRVAYSNDTEFVMFDIRVFTLESGEDNYYYVPQLFIERWCAQYGIPCAEGLFIAPLKQAITWAQEHINDNDTMWQQFGMEFEIENNIREGFVIKESCCYSHGCHRTIFKVKHPKFDDKGKKHKEPRENNTPDYSDDLMNAIEEGISCINENRFYSATSKFGEYSIKNFQELMVMMLEDIIDEIDTESLSNDELKLLRKRLQNEIGRFLGREKSKLF